MENLIKKGGNVVLNGTATQSDVRDGQTFYNTNAKSVQTGTMPDFSNEAKVATVIDETTSNIRMFIPEAGYYDTTSRVYGNKASVFGDATTANVLDGKTFTSSAGLKATGTMTDKTASSSTTRKTFTASTSAQSWAIPEGYYNANNNLVKCSAVTNTKLFEENVTSSSATTKTYTTTKAYLAVFVVYHAATYTAPGSSYYTSTVNMASSYGIVGTNGGVRLYYGVKSGATFTAKNNAGYDNQVSMRIYGIS